MCLDINGGETHQDIEGHHAPEEGLAACAPGEEHQDGGDTHMTAGEGGCGALAGFVHTLHERVEETVAPTRGGGFLHVGGEVVAHIRKHALGDLVEPCCQIVVLWTGDWQEDEDDVIDEEGTEEDELRLQELVIPPEEVEQGNESDEREIRGVTQMHQFAEHRVGAGLREQQGRLTATERLFVGGEDMVEVGEVSIELEGLRIPYPQEEQLKGDAKEHREPTGYQTIDHPESQHHHHKTEALPDQRTDIVDLRRHKECQQQCQHQIPQDDPLDGEQTFAGLLLDFKYLKTIHF